MPATPTQLTCGQNMAFFFLNTQDAGGNGRPASMVASIDNPAAAFVAVAPKTTNDQISVVPKTVTAPTTVTVTLTGTSQDGTALPSQTRQYVINPAPQPQATQIVISADAVAGIVNAPSDPGSASVTFNAD